MTLCLLIRMAVNTCSGSATRNRNDPVRVEIAQFLKGMERGEGAVHRGYGDGVSEWRSGRDFCFIGNRTDCEMIRKIVLQAMEDR